MRGVLWVSPVGYPVPKQIVCYLFAQTDSIVCYLFASVLNIYIYISDLKPASALSLWQTGQGNYLQNEIPMAPMVVLAPGCAHA